MATGEVVTHFLRGKHAESVAGERFVDVNPWTRQVRIEVAKGDSGDVDVDQAVEWSVRGIFGNSGQVCRSESRIYIEQSVFDVFVDRFLSSAERPRLGDPVRPDTEIGDEIFGALAVVAPFTDEKEAIESANSSPYGLTALVFTRDLGRAHRVSAALRAGAGGRGVSGVGSDGGDFSRDFLTEPRTVTMAVA